MQQTRRPCWGSRLCLRLKVRRFPRPIFHSIKITNGVCAVIGIIPALETAHAIHKTMDIAKEMSPTSDIVVCVSGRGDKDVISVAEALSLFGDDIGWCEYFYLKLSVGEF